VDALTEFIDRPGGGRSRERLLCHHAGLRRESTQLISPRGGGSSICTRWPLRWDVVKLPGRFAPLGRLREF
jgi:hypothetical protein